MRIPGIPGASEPSFRTRDARWMGLDSLVQETCSTLEDEGLTVSLIAAKATIQIARSVVQGPVDRTQEQLSAVIADRLRARRVIMPVEHVSQILEAYAQVIVSLEILEINEIG
jgi:hypothetical protein